MTFILQRDLPYYLYPIQTKTAITLPPLDLVLSEQSAEEPTRSLPPTSPLADHPALADRSTLPAMPTVRQKLVNAPPLFDEWVGRVDLLQALDADWHNPNRRITELIGFGGEGKSSVARRWVENLLTSDSPPLGVFWWGFYENGGIDEFFEGLAVFLLGDMLDLSGFKSASEKIRLINGVLRKRRQQGRYLLVLDGLEVLQHESGDDYGLLKSPDLREWLRDVAMTETAAFCLVTSRAPLLDLIDLTTFTHRDLERLGDAEGCELLQKLGVKGSGAELTQVVRQWDGYALVLSLLATYLVEHHSGDVRQIGQIAAPLSRESRYDRVQRVLRRYDEHLTEAERELMMLFSAFRLPVKQTALIPDSPLNRRSMGDEERSLQRLTTYRMLR
jgi:hypothetical protein